MLLPRLKEMQIITRAKLETQLLYMFVNESLVKNKALYATKVTYCRSFSTHQTYLQRISLLMSFLTFPLLVLKLLNLSHKPSWPTLPLILQASLEYVTNSTKLWEKKSRCMIFYGVI